MQSGSLRRATGRQRQHHLIRRASELAVGHERCAIRQEDPEEHRIVCGICPTRGQDTYHQRDETSDSAQHVQAMQHFTRVCRHDPTDVVENLWTESANPVENLTRKKIFRRDPPKTALVRVC